MILLSSSGCRRTFALLEIHLSELHIVVVTKCCTVDICTNLQEELTILGRNSSLKSYWKNMNENLYSYRIVNQQCPSLIAHHWKHIIRYQMNLIFQHKYEISTNVNEQSIYFQEYNQPFPIVIKEYIQVEWTFVSPSTAYKGKLT